MPASRVERAALNGDRGGQMASNPATAAEAATTESLSEVAGRVAELRAKAERSPQEARDETWLWFEQLGAETKRDRESGGARLRELFELGTPPEGIDGQTEGILVAPLIARPVDRGLNLLTGAWMPWLGKRFDAAAGTGDNVLASSARWPTKLLWPFYSSKEAGGDRIAFEFETRVEPSADDPSQQILVIDYHDIESNPRFLIRSIRDELVEIVPGANLGKVLWRNRDGSHTLIGYFALRTKV
jgi:hypothetical protein